MNDRQKSYVLRIVVTTIAVFATLILVAIADEWLRRAGQRLGSDWNNGVEVATFCVILINKVWDWASRRVWIGTEASALSTPDHTPAKGGGE